ncbi:hypothetical protein V6Z11_A11G075200 [Gossypium hirsutum]
MRAPASSLIVARRSAAAPTAVAGHRTRWSEFQKDK